MGNGLCALAAAAALGVATPAFAVDSTDNQQPLYKAFLSFCIRTNAELERVKAAVVAAGGIEKPAPIGEPPAHAQTSALAWDVIFGGRRLDVGVSRFMRLPPARPDANDDCAISSAEPEAESVTALIAWAGIADHGQWTVHHFFFSIDPSGKHVPLSKARQKAGDYWVLTVAGDESRASADLLHVLATSKP